MYLDGDPSGEQPNEVETKALAVDAGSPLPVPLASGGGFVAVVRPEGGASR
jgi:hypothetical protein